MLLEKISTAAAPDEINVIIEIPMNDNPVKYELDKESGVLVVDRFMQTTMFYPCNYGFIPGTLSDDGDPLDVLVIASYPVIPGSMIKSRPVGVLIMEDESGFDAKILAVPISKIDMSFDLIIDLDDVSWILKRRIVHFFEHYKDLEPGKWVKITGWQGIVKAKALIVESLNRAQAAE